MAGPDDTVSMRGGISVPGERITIDQILVNKGNRHRIFERLMTFLVSNQTQPNMVRVQNSNAARHGRTGSALWIIIAVYQEKREKITQHYGQAWPCPVNITITASKWQRGKRNFTFKMFEIFLKIAFHMMKYISLKFLIKNLHNVINLNFQSTLPFITTN